MDALLMASRCRYNTPSHTLQHNFYPFTLPSHLTPHFQHLCSPFLSQAILQFVDVITHTSPSILSLAIDGEEGKSGGSGSSSSGSGVLANTVER